MTVEQLELSVVVPCLNEEASIRPVVERIIFATREAGLPAEVIVVDDGSTDSTSEIVASLTVEYGDCVRLVRHESTIGIPSGWRSGTAAANGHLICFIDGDLQYHPEQVVTLYQRLKESRADLIQGVRSKIGRVRESRYWYSRALNVALNVIFGMRARDNKSGFILGPAVVIRDILNHRANYRYFQTFIRVAAESKGYAVLEVETLFGRRQAGKSFISAQPFGLMFDVLRDLPHAIWEYRIRPRRTVHAPRVIPGETSDSVASPDIERPSVDGDHPYRGWRRLLFEAYFATMPLHKWLITRRAQEMYLDLKRTEWFSEQEIRELQAEKLKRILQHVYVHVPYYRRRFDEAGITPEEIAAPEDLDKLPLLSKEDVRHHLYFDLFADNHRKREMLPINTSGSTGEPFVTYADRFQLEMRFATTLRALEWTGWRFGDRQVRLWHQTIGMSRTQVMRERIDAWFMRRLFIPAYEIGSGSVRELILTVRQHRPVLIDGYAESLNLLASYLQSAEADGLSVPAVMSSAQSLPDNVRNRIEEGLSARVYDKYGAREFSGIAYECGHGTGHHVMAESYVVELLVDGRPAQPGETGEVVVTDLNNFAVPLIRYRIGDLALAVDEAIPCPCGRAMPRIGRIEGRTQAIVHCANGTWIPGTFFAHFFKEYDYLVRMFQIHQHERGACELQIVKGDQYSDAGFNEMLGNLRRYLGVGTKIHVKFVEEIPLVKTGKRSPVVSTVRADFQTLDGGRTEDTEALMTEERGEPIEQELKVQR